MNDLMTIGLIGVAVVAVLGLGIRVVLNFKSGKSVKNNLKNVDIGRDFTGRDKK
ncbi:hypothetical protein ACQKPX_21075 [Photobacterium sp. DNB23_23_1]